MTDEKAYDKAIEAYQFHVERYNTWMNYYSIFTGALFVALYSVMDKCDKFDIVKSVITLMGLFASVCWLLSFRGYYFWLISWTKVVQHYEKASQNDKYVYLLIDKKSIEAFGYSTQKVTLYFIYMVIASWSYILFYTNWSINNTISILSIIIGIILIAFVFCTEIKKMQKYKIVKRISNHLHSDISSPDFKDINSNSPTSTNGQ